MSNSASHQRSPLIIVGLLCSIASFGGGLGLGMSLRSPGPAPKRGDLPTEEAQYTTPSFSTLVKPDCDEIEQRLEEATLAAELAHAQLRSLDRASAATWDEAPYLPSRFEAALERFAQDHPGHTTLVEDCSSYPCIAVMQTPASASAAESINVLRNALDSLAPTTVQWLHVPPLGGAEDVKLAVVASGSVESSQLAQVTNRSAQLEGEALSMVIGSTPETPEMTRNRAEWEVEVFQQAAADAQTRLEQLTAP